MRLPERIKYILFDMDDVLVHTRALDKEVKERVFAPLGIVWEQIAPIAHLTMKEMVPALFTQTSITANIDQYIGKYFSLYNQSLSQRLTENAVPGAVFCIQSAYNAGYTLALVTTSTIEQANIVLDGLQVCECFKVVITSRDVQRGKPHPEPYQKAIIKLDAQPEHCAVIEDLPTGIASAKAVSSDVFVIALTTTRSAGDLARADVIIHSFTEVEL